MTCAREEHCPYYTRQSKRQIKIDNKTALIKLEAERLRIEFVCEDAVDFDTAISILEIMWRWIGYQNFKREQRLVEKEDNGFRNWLSLFERSKENYKANPYVSYLLH